MPTMFADDVHLSIPVWVMDLAAFRRWTEEPDFPEQGNIWWLRGEVWADMSKEQYYWHLMVKGELFRVLANLAVEENLGDVVPDGLLLTNTDAGISGNPDLTFISREAFESGRAVKIQGKTRGITEVEGVPDMVAEVVSDSSEEKDYVTLREDYFLAGIAEYWIVDARTTPLTFEILRRNATGFVPARKQSGWMKSVVFKRSFRLVELSDYAGNPVYRLEVK